MDDLTQRYLKAVAAAWERLRREEPAVLLPDVFILLPAVRASRPREELPPEPGRLGAALGQPERAEEALRDAGRGQPEGLADEVRISSEPPVPLADRRQGAGRPLRPCDSAQRVECGELESVQS